MLWFHLIMAACMLPALGIEYVMQKNQAKYQKGLLLGVTLPESALALPEVQAILARYRRELAAACLGCAALCLPVLLLRSMWVAFTLWMLLVIAMVILPVLPFVRANRALKAVKRAQGGPAAPPLRRVDPAASEAALPKPLGLRSLLMPLAVSLLPVLLPGQLPVLRLTYVADAGMVVLLWGIGRWAFRRRADMITADAARNQTLLRVRRLYWDRYWRLSLWACAGLNLCIGLFPRGGAGLLVGAVGFTFALLGGVLWMELGVRRAQQRLTEGVPVLADEDDAWLWGLVYYNPSDPHWMVAQRVGVGTTVNLATRPGKALAAFTAVLLALCVLAGPWLGWLEGQPARLEVRDGALRALHGSSVQYELPLAQLGQAELRETLPSATRTWGTGMEHYLQGDFHLAGEGGAKLCLDPTQPPFLRVEAGGRVYWLGSADPAETRAVLDEVLRQAAP